MPLADPLAPPQEREAAAANGRAVQDPGTREQERGPRPPAGGDTAERFDDDESHLIRGYN